MRVSITCHEEMETQPSKELTLVGKSGKFHWALKKELFGEKGKLPFAGTGDSRTILVVAAESWLMLVCLMACMGLRWLDWTGFLNNEGLCKTACFPRKMLITAVVFVIYFLKEKYNKVVRYILSQLCNTSLSIMPNKEKWVKAFGFTLNLALLSTLFIKISGSEK